MYTLLPHVLQVLTVSEVVDRVCAWMQQTQCCTTGTLSVLRQVSPFLLVLLHLLSLYINRFP